MTARVRDSAMTRRGATRTVIVFVSTVCATLLAGGLGGLGGSSGPFFAAPIASAHTELESSTPADRGIVTDVVDEIELVFTEPVEPVADGFEVLLPDGDILAVEPTTEDGITFLLTFDPPIGNGEVGVRFEVISDDGHPVSGSFSFTIDDPTPESTDPDPIESETTNPAVTDPEPDDTTTTAAVTTTTTTGGDPSTTVLSTTTEPATEAPSTTAPSTTAPTTTVVATGEVDGQSDITIAAATSDPVAEDEDDDEDDDTSILVFVGILILLAAAVGGVVYARKRGGPPPPGPATATSTPPAAPIAQSTAEMPEQPAAPEQPPAPESHPEP